MHWGLEVLGNISTSLIDLANNVSLHGYEGLFVPAPLTSWRVTPENPVRYSGSLDVERCVALHNEILWHGWNASGGKPEEFPGVNWFDHHGSAAKKARNRLSSPVSTFLDGALAINATHNFLYHIGDLQWPSSMWSYQEWPQNPAERDRFLTLYVANSHIASHSDGLVYDQLKHKALMQPSIHDAGITHNGRQEWYPLEVILTAWLDMIDTGKIKAVPDGTQVPYEKVDPWIMLPYSQKQLNNTVKAFEGLVDAIEARMQKPNQEDSQHLISGQNGDVSHLLSAQDLRNAEIPEGFAYAFLTTVRRPNFQYIAPGLSVPTSESIKAQPFFSILRDKPIENWDEDDETRMKEIPPIMLFMSDEKYETWRDPTLVPQFADSYRPFNWPYSQLKSFPAGLYFTDHYSWDMYGFEDAVKFVLPYPLGGFGYARTADGARFGENREERGTAGYVDGGGTFADLFQLGYNPYLKWHDVQLEHVLNAWTRLVEAGEWKIGKNGVEDSMQKWKDADTAKKWSKYTVPVSW